MSCRACVFLFILQVRQMEAQEGKVDCLGLASPDLSMDLPTPHLQKPLEMEGSPL
jgi:hypothetical protein